MIEKDWLYQRYVVDLLSVEEIARQGGCSTHNIGRLLHKYQIKRGRAYIETKPIWNKGLTKDTDPRLAKLSESRKGEGNPMYGKAAWNKGLTKEMDPRLVEVGRKNSLRPVSEETKEKFRQSKLGKFGESSNAWKGGTRKTVGGYYQRGRLGKDGKAEIVYHHRMIAEEILGRYLTKLEHVHHIDRDKTNNNPDNLLVLQMGVHTRLHKAIDAGFCDTRDEQIAWLQENGYKFEVLDESKKRKTA